MEVEESDYTILYALLILKFLESELKNTAYYIKAVNGNESYNKYVDYVINSSNYRKINKLFAHFEKTNPVQQLPSSAYSDERISKMYLLSKLKVFMQERQNVISILESMKRLLEEEPIDKEVLPRTVQGVIKARVSARSR